MSLNGDRRVMFEDLAVQTIRPASERTPLPSVGQFVKFPKRLETLSGFATEGNASAAYYDHWGEALVNVERSGRLVACGVGWPIEVIR